MAEVSQKTVEQQANEIVDKAKKGETIDKPISPAVEKQAREIIKNYAEADKKKVTDALDALKNTLTSSDPLGDLAQKKIFENDLRDNLKEQLKSMDGKLETMSPQELETALGTTENILGMTWLDTIPGWNEGKNKAKEYQPMISGIVGATLIQKIQSLGYSFYFVKPKEIKVVSDKTDARDMEIKLNAHINKSTVLADSIQSGLLYLSPSFHTYRSVVSNNEGKITDPSSVGIDSYEKYLKTNADKNLSEKIFLQSAQYYDRSFDFQKLLIQSKDLGKVATFVSNNPTLASQVQSSSPVAPVAIPRGIVAPSTTLTTAPSTTAGKAAGVVGNGIGTVAGGIGSLIGTVASETGSTWSTILSEATKTGGSIGAIGVIGLLIGSIWKFGFWKTMMGVVGVGGASAIANAAEDGTFDKLADKMKKGGDKFSDAVGKIAGDVSTTVAPAVAVTAPLASSSSIDISKLDEIQKKGVRSIESNQSLITDIQNYPKKSGKQAQSANLNTYIATLHKDSIQNITLDKIIYTKDHEQSIFSDEVKSQLPNNEDIPVTASRYLLKRVIRSYIGINSTLSASNGAKKEGQDTLDSFKTKYPEDTWKTKTLKDLINHIHQ